MAGIIGVNYPPLLTTPIIPFVLFNTSVLAFLSSLRLNLNLVTQCTNVKNGKLNIGIIYSSIDNPSIKSEVLNVEKYSAVVSLNSKFAKNESISLMDLINEPIVLMPKSSASRKNIDEAFNCINHICKPMIQVANLTSCVTLIQDSDNISILPESFIKSLCNKPFKILPISDYPPRETINLIYRKDLFLDPILKDFLTIIKDFHNNN